MCAREELWHYLYVSSYVKYNCNAGMTDIKLWHYLYVSSYVKYNSNAGMTDIKFIYSVKVTSINYVHLVEVSDI